MSKKKDHPKNASEKHSENPAELREKSPRRRFTPLTRAFIVVGLVLIAWLLTGTTMQWFVPVAMSGREFDVRRSLSRVASILQPWDGDLNLAPARCAPRGRPRILVKANAAPRTSGHDEPRDRT